MEKYLTRINQKTDYVVKQFEGNDEQGYHEKGDLYKSGEYVGNIYLRSTSKNNDSAPLHPTQTCYLWLSYSDDDGVTWSDPVDIDTTGKSRLDEILWSWSGIWSSASV